MMEINEQEIISAVMECEFMIRKTKGNGQSQTEFVVKGNYLALASIIGNALCEIANIDKRMNYCMYCVCKAIVDEYEEKHEKDR